MDTLHNISSESISIYVINANGHWQLGAVVIINTYISHSIIIFIYYITHLRLAI